MDTQLFEETIKQDTPRLVIMLHRQPNGDEQFQWGVVGHIPVLSLIGAVVHSQGLIDHNARIDLCPQEAFVIAWDQEERVFNYFSHPNVICDSCLGMLELIKNTLVDTHRARTAVAQQIILADKNGRPIH